MLVSYESTSIARIITKLNVEYFLPAIQRPYVWKTEQLIRLFDSILKGYPISSFLFWDLQEENKGNWDIYKFIENFTYGDTHNEMASTDGLSVNLVLDGQQRLTSLFIGLRGTYTTKRKYKRSNSSDAWTKQQLYINLLKDPKLDDNDDVSTEVSYGLSMFESQPENTDTSYWFRMGKVLEFDDAEKFEDFKETLIESLPDTITRREETLVARNLNRLRKVMWEDDVISYYTEMSQSYDRVLDIFIRANDGGTKLSKSDLLLSMMTSKWGARNAREEIYDFVNTLNTGLTRENNIDKDVVMKSCLLLSDLPHTYKVSNFTKENLEKIESNWDAIKESLVKTLQLVNQFGIDAKTLTSANALLPIAYYLIKNRRITFNTTEQSSNETALSIRRWLLVSLLNSTFGGTSDRTIGLAKDIINEHGLATNKFPLTHLTYGLRKHGTYTQLDTEFIESILTTQYGDRTCFLALSLLHEGRNFGDTNYHIDHIFPKSLFTTANLRSHGVSESNITAYQSYCNRLGNLQILSSLENTQKSARDFSVWISSRDDLYKREYCIPSDTSLYDFDRFIDFVNRREQMLKKRLQNNLSLHSTSFAEQTNAKPKEEIEEVFF